jgi:hypothetical protein
MEEVVKRVSRLERQREAERARSSITEEMRRMHSSISPQEHPGLYANMDLCVTIHGCSPSHRGVLALTGGCMMVIKNVDIKVIYLADAEFQYARRLCAEGGENLTDAQVLEIEAKVLDFHGRL